MPDKDTKKSAPEGAIKPKQESQPLMN